VALQNTPELLHAAPASGEGFGLRVLAQRAEIFGNVSSTAARRKNTDCWRM
jgi:hypothetical protein